MVSRSERILVTGAGGFTGKWLCDRLAQDRREIVRLCRPGTISHGLAIDIRDLSALTDVLSRTRPDAIIHFAAISAPTWKELQDIYSINTLGTANLFEALVAAKIQPRLIVVASSATVYAVETDKRGMVRERSAVAPKSHYAISKHASEEIAQIYSTEFPIIITRPFNYSGSGQPTSFLVPKIVEHYVRRARSIKLGNLNLIRDYSDIERVVEAYTRLLSLRPLRSDIVNICSGRGTCLEDIPRLMENISGHRLDIETDPTLLRKDESPVIIGSTIHLEELVGPLPNPDFSETLRRMYRALSGQ